MTDVQYTVISADKHILEPPNALVERVPTIFRDQAPRTTVRGISVG